MNDAARTALEALMRSGTYEYQSEFARRYLAQGREEGRQEGEVIALLEQLERWLLKALSVQSVQELFES